MEKIIIDKIGSDIEFALQDITTGEWVSAEGLIQGTKKNPFRFDPNNEHYATSLDNVLYEGNIPPAKSAFEFYQNVRTLQNFMQNQLPKNLKLRPIAAASFDEKYLNTPNAKVYGCEPSIDAWSEEIVQPKPNKSNIRAAGGHIHISYNNPHFQTSFNIVKAMDLFLGVPAVILEPANKRKSTGYGVAGNCRLSSWGVEYRSLSGYFFGQKRLIEWCFKNTKKAVNYLNLEGIDELNKLRFEIQNTINFEDKLNAEKLINQFKINLP